MYTHPLYHWPPKSLWSSNRLKTRSWGSFSAYVHFPFCRNICNFCGYETRLIDKRSASRFPALAVDEIRHQAKIDDFTHSRLKSIFFGGGTASLLKEADLAGILGSLKNLAAPDVSEPEVTLECEPGTINRQRLVNMRSLGVNRISVCAQSFDDNELKRITRKHTNSDTFYLVNDCIAAGFSNLHVDLMYGLPGQTLEDWERNLKQVITLPIKHISLYKLYVFKHGSLHRNNVVARPCQEKPHVTDQLEAMHNLGIQICEEAGFQQYSLTEFSKPDYQCIYIKESFGGRDILPIGPSAFGRHGYEIWENPRYVSLYGNNLVWERKKRAAQLSRLEGFKRDVILGLWLLSANVNQIAKLYHVSPSTKLRELINDFALKGLIDSLGGSITVERNQRYKIGSVMVELANLDAIEWGGTAYDESKELENMPPCVLNRPQIELNAIIQTARRDPKFFEQLRISPMQTLEEIGVDLSPDIISDLIGVILGCDEGIRNEDIKDFQNNWLNVIVEHSR